MKIAFFGDHTPSSVKRAICYMENCQGHDVTYVLAWSYMVDDEKEQLNNIGNRLCKSFSIINLPDYVSTNFDAVINTSDKHFHARLEHKGLTTNLVNKETLYYECERHGILSPSIKNLEGRRCFIKPKISSGAYDDNDLGYHDFDYSELVKIRPDRNKYLVQEYLESIECVLFIFLCNGKDIVLIDSSISIFGKDNDGKPLCVYGDFTTRRHEIIQNIFQKQLNQTVEMMYNLQYNKLNGTFNVQFSVTKDGQAYLHDFNTRTGPFSIEIENRKFFDTGFYSTFEYQLGLVDKLNVQKESWIHYTEDQDGKLLIPREMIFSNPKGCIQINSDKKSGMVRSDYNVFINRY